VISEAERRQMLEVLAPAGPASRDAEGRWRALRDRLEIESLIHRYGYLEDFRTWDELLDLYTDDVERVLGGTLEQHVAGKEALRALYESLTLPGDRAASSSQLASLEVKHFITGIVVQLRGDEASAVARYTISAEGPVDGSLARGTHDGSYVFHLRRTPAGWKFRHMLVISGNAQNPMFQRPGGSPDDQ
jgi:SnoaL-like domain